MSSLRNGWPDGIRADRNRNCCHIELLSHRKNFLTFCEEMLECTIGFADKEKRRSCQVVDYFLPEREGHRLKALFSSDNFTKFPWELRSGNQESHRTRSLNGSKRRRRCARYARTSVCTAARFKKNCRAGIRVVPRCKNRPFAIRERAEGRFLF